MSNFRCRIKKDDKVKILAGKDKGKIGKVLKISTKNGRVFVEKINQIKRHVKPSAQNRQGGIVETESAIHLSNVMLMCNKCLNATRVRMQLLEDGKKVRICKKCNEQLDT